MNKKILFFSILILFFVPVFSSLAASPISISLNGQQFKPGEEVKAQITVANVFGKQFKGKLIMDFISINPEFPPMPRQEEIDLSPAQKSQVYDLAMSVGEDMPAGLWRVDAELRDEHDNLVMENHQDFTIIGTKKNIEAELLICPDKNCGEHKAVYIQGEAIYLKLKTPETNLQIQATIARSQNEEAENIAFTDKQAQLKAEKTGSYIINITLNKEGYSTQTIQKDLAVIASPAKIKSASVCTVDGRCKPPETIQNCPQDCLTPAKTGLRAQTKPEKKQVIFFVLLIIIILGGMFAAWYFLIREKKREKKEDEPADNRPDDTQY